jgi:uncharacterized membrane protein YqjE
MMEILEDLAFQLNDALLQPRLRRFKARILLALVTAAVLGLFILMGMVCLFMMVFFSLKHTYDESTAAVILFCFCVVICLGTLLVHAIARRLEDRPYDTRFEARHPRRRRERPESAPRGPSFVDQAREYFVENKVAGLAGVAAAGVLLGAKPGMVLRTAAWLLGRRSRRMRPGRDRYERDRPDRD